MFERTVLAGTGGRYVRLTALHTLRGASGASSTVPMSIVGYYGASLTFGPGTLTISNGATDVILDLTESDEVQKTWRGEDDAVRFSAPLRHSAKLYAFNEGQRLDVVILPLGTYEARNPGSATQAVLHTPRKYHGPGLYPETNKWGRWINSYRREADERAAARAARGR